MNTCPTCNFESLIPIDAGFTLRVSEMGIYNDARFPGRSIVRLRERATDLTEVSPPDLSDFMLDVQSASAAIFRLVNTGGTDQTDDDIARAAAIEGASGV